MRRAVLTAVCALLGTVALLGGQGPSPFQGLQSPPARRAPQEPPVDVFRSGVELVQVDVYVTDENDQPVSGLTADDFEVFENGAPQVITAFAPVTIPIERSEPLPFGAESDVQTNNRPERHVYLFILARTSVEMALRTRHLVRRFMDEHFGDDDIGAVITGRTYPGDRQDFTSNRRLLLSAVDRFDGGVLFTNELADLMELMERVPGGRKVVVWFGRTGIDPFEILDYHGEIMTSREQEEAHAAIAAATRGNIRFYLINPEGLSLPDQTGERPAMGFGGPDMNARMLAAMTGGFALTNSNTFDDAFERLVRETSTYYQLGFESTNESKEGRFIRLEVQVKRPGLKVKSRTGYLETLRYNRRRVVPEPERTPVEAALANPLATGGVPMRVFAAPYKKSGRDATVALVVDLDASELAFVEKDGAFSAGLEIRHLATDVNHKIYPEYRHAATIGLDARSYQQVTASGMRVISEFDAPSGRYQVRVASASGDRNGSVVYDLEVPDFRDGPLALSGVALATLAPDDTVSLRPDRNRRSREKSQQCRSSACEASVILESALTPWAGTGKGEATLLRDVLPVPPTTAREFGGTETLVLFAEVYDNNGRARRDPPYAIDLAARLHDTDGTVVRVVSERRSSRADTRPSGGHGFTLRLPLDGAPAGQYVLQVEARSERDVDHRAVRNIPIRVR
jgi:VWFA-related protein